MWYIHDCFEHLVASMCSLDGCHWLQLWYLHVSGPGVSCHISSRWKTPQLGRKQYSLSDLPHTVPELCNGSGHWQMRFLSGQAGMHSAVLQSVRDTVRAKLILVFRTTKVLADCTYSKLWSPVTMLRVLLGHWHRLPLLQHFVSSSCLCSCSPIGLLDPGIIVFFSSQGVGCIAKDCILPWIW